MSEQLDWTVIGTQAGIGFFLGLAVGYTIKKTAKVALFVIGAAVLLGILLEQYDFITINWGTIQETYETTFGDTSLQDKVSSLQHLIASYIPVTGGFGVGFLVGIKTG